MTVNGKLDRDALPDPDWSVKAGGDYVAPRNETELHLAGLWAGILGVDRVGVHDGFFDLGGHSLLIMQLIRQIELATGEHVTIADVFENPTISEFSPILEGAVWKVVEQKKSGLLARLRSYLFS